MVDELIERRAAEYLREIKAMAESARRSIGQRVRRQREQLRALLGKEKR